MEGSAATDHRSHDGAAAARAGLAGPVVDVELSLHAPAVPARVDVVAPGRAAHADPLPQHPADGLVQSRDLRRRERAGLPLWVDARAPERLDVVDVPDPGDLALIEQQRLDRGARAALQHRREPTNGEAARQRFDAQRDVQRLADRTALAVRVQEISAVDDLHAPELPRVRE